MVDDSEPEHAKWPEMLSRSMRRHAPLWLAIALVGTVLGGLLIGYEPVGGDPDRLYRPLKSELARALRQGTLPYWSSRFGLGVPLVAESHVAAFYPPNLVLYRVFDISTAYRLSMWCHYVALVATTYLYARCVGLSAWGSSLAGVSFALCGFQAIHSSHEPFFTTMPYLTLALFCTERSMASGRLIWLAILALCLGAQWTLGHFQIQMWTGILVIMTALWRAGFNSRLWGRALGVMAATGWGVAVAALQLGLSWQFADYVGQSGREARELLFYSFPPSHWFELVLPRLIRELPSGPEGPYWFGQQSSGYEAALYVGTIPLIFAVMGAFGRPVSRSALFWRILLPVSFAIATMPRWWPEGYLQFVALPGIGYFRVAARYTLLSSLGLAILGGEGFDRTISRSRVRLGLAATLILAMSAAFAGWSWARGPDVDLISPWGGMTVGFVWGAAAWLVAIAFVLAWRSERLPSWALLAATGTELGFLFYLGTTQWGWSVALPSQSPILSELVRRSPSGLVGGEIENLPIRANLATAAPYLGLAHPPANRILVLPQELLLRGESISPVQKLDPTVLTRWLLRCRVSHLVGRRQRFLALGRLAGNWQDPALDQIYPRKSTDPAELAWSIVELGKPAPEVRVALRARTVADRRSLINRLSREDDRDLAWFLADDHVPPRPDARSGHLLSWDGTAATIEHDGTCDVVIARTFDAGWMARIDAGPHQSVLPVDGGFQAVRLPGSGRHRVTLSYRPPRFLLYTTISLVALALAAGVILAAVVSWAWSRSRIEVARAVTG